MLRHNTRTLQASQLDRNTDRYIAAVEQLGSETIDVRLGGIYALEQLAVDPGRAQHPATIVELLGAFTRFHSDPLYQRRYRSPSSSEPTGSPDVSVAEVMACAECRVKAPADVQAAITVLGRLPDKVSSRGDLAGAYLCGAVLTQAKFAGAIFTGACLAEADFSNADLARALLVDTDLTHAVLAGADLTAAKLAGADLTGADLTGADLTGADLTGAILIDAVLMDATLVDADLTRADLPHAYLNEADLTRADLTDANLTGADLTGARLTRATLTRTYLIEAIVRDADVTAADLGAAKLAGADFSNTATLQQRHIERADGNVDTVLPDRLVRPARWS